jgi:ABC-type uncharacterized transport system permease subunit
LTAILFPLDLVAFTTGIVLSILSTVNRSEAARRGALGAYVMAWILQLAGLSRIVVEHGHIPLRNMAEFLLTLGWLVLTLYLVVQIRWKMHVAGLVLPPLAFVMTVVGLRLPLSEAPGPLLQPSGFLLFHTSLATLGMAAFFVAATMSLIYVVQDRALKGKRSFLWLDRLPPLMRLDRVGLEALLWGFPLFTLGIVSGMLLNAQEHHRLIVLDAKQIFPLLAWLIFAGVLIARLVRGFRGRKAAYLTITGFALGLLTIIGIAV